MDRDTPLSLCVIYKIQCKVETVTDLYVGHQFNLPKITLEHKKNVANNPNRKICNLKLYQVIRANGIFKNWEVVII